jgi:hypothetical protein
MCTYPGSNEFVIKVGAGTVKACLVLNDRNKRHNHVMTIYDDNCKTKMAN